MRDTPRGNDDPYEVKVGYIQSQNHSEESNHHWSLSKGKAGAVVYFISRAHRVEKRGSSRSSTKAPLICGYVRSNILLFYVPNSTSRMSNQASVCFLPPLPLEYCIVRYYKAGLASSAKALIFPTRLAHITLSIAPSTFLHKIFRKIRTGQNR